jgi:hypothetical protein
MKTFRISTWVMAAALALGVSTARAEDARLGMANAKNLVEHTVTIDDQVYRVGSNTRILNHAGRPMELSEVVTEADLGGRVELDRVTYAYEANGGVLVLLQAADPRY